MDQAVLRPCSVGRADQGSSSPSPMQASLAAGMILVLPFALPAIGGRPMTRAERWELISACGPVSLKAYDFALRPASRDVRPKSSCAGPCGKANVCHRRTCFSLGADSPWRAFALCNRGPNLLALWWTGWRSSVWRSAGPRDALHHAPQVYAKELVALRPDILVGNSTPAAAALLRETRTIPIVFVGVSDPAGSHFVASIPKPGGSSSPLGRRICARG
jgi:ABC transporter substrate binding protein